MMKHVVALLLLLTSQCFAGQGMFPVPMAYVSGGGSTTWGPTQITSTENDNASVANPLDATSANLCLDGDGSSVGSSSEVPLGVRWVTTIPEGATITDSELKVYVGWPENSSAYYTVRVYGEDVAASVALNTGSGLGARTLTTAYADFVITAPAVGSGGYATLNSTALDAVIEEVVGNSGFNGTITLILIDQNGAGDTQEMQINTLCSTAMNELYYSSLEVTYE